MNDCLKAGRSGLLVKLDLEKDYNYVNWIFLDYMLGMMGFKMKWRNWIYTYVSLVAFFGVPEF